MKLNSDLLLGIVYIPPEYSRYSSPDTFSQIENEYLEFTEKFKNICLLIGDLNARTAEDDEFITLDENTLFEIFDDFIENAPNVLQQLNLPLKRNNNYCRFFGIKGVLKNMNFLYVLPNLMQFLQSVHLYELLMDHNFFNYLIVVVE